MNKTKQELRTEILKKLTSSLGINVEDEGSIALGIVDALLDEIYLLYEELQFVKDQAYLTTSSSGYTELIANLVNTKRRDFESDDNLKLRAKNSVYRHAGGNKLAIEEAARGISGVAGTRYREFGYGTGSFIMYIYPEANENQVLLKERVKEAISEVVSDGIHYEVKAPTEIPVDLEIIINIKEGKSISERNSLRNRVERSLRGYLNNFSMNDILYINEIISRAMSVSEDIIDVNIVEYKVGGVQRPLTNTYPANEERFISGIIKIN